MRARPRSEDGFGLVELLIAMTILNIGILAIVAAFSSGAASLHRASMVSTASALADKQMELYRALRYEQIVLDEDAVDATDSVYEGDSALPGNDTDNLVTIDPCPTSPLPAWCDPSRMATGADGRSYRVDTYIVAVTPPDGREVKQVTIVVRRGDDLARRPLARTSSTFDRSTGT